MKCPNCKTKLERLIYEGLPIRTCETCHGNLVEHVRLKSIQHRRENIEEELVSEVALGKSDSQNILRCPRCLSYMEKKRTEFGSEAFWIDDCPKCKLTWLNGGELAKMQVIYEYSDQGQEMKRFKDRNANMTAQEKAEHARRIAELPEKTFLTEVILAGFLEALGGADGSDFDL